jgi:hypothetical protein
MPIEDPYLEQRYNKLGTSGGIGQPSTTSPSYIPTTGVPVPFADAANPIMAQVAFLASAVSPAVASAAAAAALRSLSDDNAVDRAQAQAAAAAATTTNNDNSDTKRTPKIRIKLKDENGVNTMDETNDGTATATTMEQKTVPVITPIGNGTAIIPENAPYSNIQSLSSLSITSSRTSDGIPVRSDDIVEVVLPYGRAYIHRSNVSKV